MADKTDISKRYSGRFQLTVDTDSILISQAPDNKQSRVTLANLQEEQIEQIVKGLDYAGLTERVLHLLKERLKS